MKNILVISGHPELTHSVANATILDEVETALPDVEIRRLDRLYPDGKFNIAAEQESLLRADVIVWQFPFSWYGLPGLMKKWLDEVFVHGFAHGSTAKLGGKKLILSFTTGAPEELYTVDSFFGHTIEEYLIPFETTARLCNLELLAPVYTCGISYADRDADKIAQQKTLAFNGIEDAENNTLLKLDEGSNTASGLGIEILDGNMRPVKLNDLHAGMQWIPLVPEQNNILPYSARLKSTQKSVNPGLVRASATFTLEFQ